MLDKSILNMLSSSNKDIIIIIITSSPEPKTHYLSVCLFVHTFKHEYLHNQWGGWQLNFI